MCSVVAGSPVNHCPMSGTNLGDYVLGSSASNYKADTWEYQSEMTIHKTSQLSCLKPAEWLGLDLRTYTAPKVRPFCRNILGDLYEYCYS